MVSSQKNSNTIYDAHEAIMQNAANFHRNSHKKDEMKHCKPARFRTKTKKVRHANFSHNYSLFFNMWLF